MFEISIIITILLVCESCKLFKSHLKKTSIKMALLTVVFFLLNFFMLYKGIKVNYSQIIYLLSFLANNPVITILWILLNVVLYLYIGMFLLKLKKKHKQNKLLFISILTMYFLYDALLIFVVFHNLMVYVLLIILISSIVLLVKSYLKERKNYSIILIIVLGLFTYYSYFTFNGAAKLQIAFMGYPYSAYDTGLEELTHLKSKSSRHFYPIKNIPVENGEMGIIVVKNYFGIKIGKYVGF